jgi:hypothetical protein
MVPAAVIAGAIVVGMANGSIAASFSVSGTDFKLSADSLEGDGFVQYGGLVNKADGTGVPVAIAGIHTATMTNMCQSVGVPGTPISLVLRAGTDPTQDSVVAEDLLIDMTDLQGNATFKHIDIGQDASTLTDGPSGQVGQVGGFGQQATHIEILKLRQTTWFASAGKFTLPGLHLAVTTDKSTCY